VNILLTGAISLSNKGTAATVISVITMLKKTFPNSKICIELFYPEKQRIIDIEKEYGVNVIAPLMQSPLKAILLFLLAILILPFRKLGIKCLNAKKLEHYGNADVIIDISAEGFVRFYNESYIQTTIRFLLHLYPVLIGLILKKPVVLLAQSLAPFGVFRPVMKNIIKNSVLVTVRDPTSIENLKKEKIDVSKIHLTADPAFLLDVASNDRIYIILKSEGIDLAILRNKKVIGICAGMILNPEKHEKLIKMLAKAADSLIEEYCVSVLFIPHSSGKIREISDDVFVGTSIMRYVKNKGNFYLIKGDYTPQELKGIIGKLDCLVSLRMHPVIFASSMKVPSVIIAFNPKAYGLMKMLGLDNNVVHEDEVQTELLIARIRNCLSNSEYLKNTLGENLPLINEEALLNMHLLKRVLHEK
jgi:colanic acid/amylovoran biosynthesis protein